MSYVLAIWILVNDVYVHHQIQEFNTASECVAMAKQLNIKIYSCARKEFKVDIK